MAWFPVEQFTDLIGVNLSGARFYVVHQLCDCGGSESIRRAMSALVPNDFYQYSIAPKLVGQVLELKSAEQSFNKRVRGLVEPVYAAGQIIEIP